MTMHPLYEDSLHRRLHDMSEAYDIVVERERWYNSCPEWFKPLRDMGISHSVTEWLYGWRKLLHKPNTTDSDWEILYQRYAKLNTELAQWLKDEPK